MKTKFFPNWLRLMTVFALLLAALAPASTAHAATCTVTTDADNGAGSLREKIADPACDTIDFDNDYTIPLASELNIDRNLTIDGAGHNVTVSGDTNSDGTGDVRMFDVYPGVTFNLNQLTATKGNAGSGGGIYNNGGTLNVTNSTFSGNNAPYGGAIYNNDGTVSLTNGTFSANSASNGGAIFNFSGAVHIINSTFESNTTTSSGGGIYIRAGIVNITSSTFSGNRASTGGAGGAIALSGIATLNITNSTFSGNTASVAGGGIYVVAGAVSITNSTISGNFGYTGGGGIYNNGGAITLRNTIVANNTGSSNCGGAITDGGGNLVWGDTSCPGINADPKLSALADNGGHTQTMALQAGSAAIDAADSANCPATDQRGYGRNGTCDIGAYEYDCLATPDLTIAKANDVGGTTTIGGAFDWTLTVSNGAGTAMWFTAPEVILRDELPSSGATYGTPTPGNFTGVTNSNNISCSIANKT
ncbi:MAG: choice-of-anchor Q domain-containing protein [Chloroflexota bacterium]